MSVLNVGRTTRQRLLPMLAGVTVMTAAGLPAVVAAAPADAATTPQIFTWGDNEFGQLGDGTMASRSTPMPVAALAPGGRQVAVGEERDLDAVVNADGTVSTWG